MRIFILACLTLLLYVRCANIVPPSGGPRDVTAPKITSSIPSNGTTNYTSKHLIVVFDEDIADNQLSTKILVSPTITGNYKVKIKKNILRLEWLDTLKENTTYTFNLSNGIKDLTEGTTITNYPITFSTGPDIDSNSIQSSILPIPGQAINPNTKILIVPVQDSVLKYLKLKPEYIGTATNGTVEIPYIKNGRYTILSIIDHNNNNVWNLNEPVDIHKNVEIKGKILDTFHVNNSTLDTAKLVSVNNLDKNFKLLFSKGLQKISITDSTGIYLVNQTSGREYYIENQFKHSDSTIIHIDIVDSSGVNSGYRKKIKFKTIDYQKDKDSIIYIEDINKTAFIKPHFDSIQFKTTKFVDSIPFNIQVPKHITYTYSNSYKNLSIYLKGQKEGDSIIISIPRGNLTSIYKEYNKVFKQKLIVGEEKELGNLTFTISTKQPKFIIRLTDDKNNIIYTSANTYTHHVKNLKPAEYTLSAFIDTNNNGVWDAYNPLKDIPAEPIYYYKDKILIKANWDIEDIQMIF